MQFFGAAKPLFGAAIGRVAAKPLGALFLKKCSSVDVHLRREQSQAILFGRDK